MQYRKVMDDIYLGLLMKTWILRYTLDFLGGNQENSYSLLQYDI